MNLEAYLISKKIDPVIFQEKEPALWKSWSVEIEQMHPNSFTAQKLYLINPIRRKYPLKETPAVQKINPPTPAPASTTITIPEDPATPSQPAKPVMSKPAIPRPVFKPKPKTS